MSDTSFLNPINNQSTVDVITDEMINAIVNGMWAPGSKIPTELELAEAFNAGRGSVREAIKALATLGLVQVKRSSGTYVSETFSEKMLNPLIYSFALEGDAIKQLAELRLVINFASIFLAIKNGNADDIALIEEKCNEYCRLLSEHCVSAEELLDADIAFHDSINASAHNTLFRRLAYIAERIGRPSRLKNMELEIGKKDSVAFYINTHKAILDVIKEKREEDILEVAKNHLSHLFSTDDSTDE